MDLANLQLPATLVNSVKGFNFVEEPLWRVSQQRTTVKIEITWALPDTNLPTNQQARAVRVDMAARRYRRQPRQQPARTTLPRVPEMRPPADEQMTTQPATVTYQRPVSTAVIPPSATMIHHRQLPPAPPTPEPSTRKNVEPKRKFTRASTPKQLPSLPHPETLTPEVTAGRVGQSSPVPMEEEACAADTAFVAPTRPRNSTLTQKMIPGSMSPSRLEKYDLERVFIHNDGKNDLCFIEGKQRRHREKTEPVFFAHYMGSSRNNWLYWKGPSSKHYVEAWWDFFNEVTYVNVPVAKKQSKTLQNQLRDVCRDNRQLLRVPTMYGT